MYEISPHIRNLTAHGPHASTRQVASGGVTVTSSMLALYEGGVYLRDLYVGAVARIL